MLTLEPSAGQDRQTLVQCTVTMRERERGNEKKVFHCISVMRLFFYIFFDFFFYACQSVIKSQRWKAKMANQASNILHPAMAQAVLEIEFDPCAITQRSKSQVPPCMAVSMV